MVFFFGGGWKKGSMDQFEPHAIYFAKRGITCFLVDYRVKDRHQTTPFESLKDAKSALRFVRSNAEKFKIERKSLLEANRLSEGQPIYIGETLMIPGAAPAPDANMAEAGKPADAKKDSVVIGETKKPETAPVPAPAPVGTKTHKIVKGDTLTSVAKKYSTSVESIKSANGLRSDTISLGQTLKIPSTQTVSTDTKPAPEKKQEQSNAFQYDNELLRAEETYGYYTVNKGDNLYALARDFFTTMSELQRINRLGASTTIFPGNEIIVPTAKYNAYHKTGEAGEMVNR
jgi:LysM repeat protein